MLDVKVEQFEGPLDLLLRLIEAEDLDITAISLAKVTDDYLSAIQLMAEDERRDEIADFLVIAAKLLLLKSRSLLPSFASNSEDEEILDLEAQLRRYRDFVKAAAHIALLYDGPQRSFTRPESRERPTEVSFAPPKMVQVTTFPSVMRMIIDRLKPHVSTVKKIPIDITVTIQERLATLRTLMTFRDRLDFWEFCKDSKSKSEIIASFLATLELVKQRLISVHQQELFSDITLATP